MVESGISVGVILLLRGLRVYYFPCYFSAHLSLAPILPAVPHSSVVKRDGWILEWDSGSLETSPSPVQVGAPWVLALQVSRREGAECAHLHSGVAQWGLGLLRFSTAQQWRVGSQLLVPNVLSVSCKRF